MTKKNYISIALFSFLSLVFYFYLDNAFRTPHFFNNSISDFKSLSKKTDIDIIFYGSSHSYKTFNPLIVNHNCKIVSYNLGSDALALSLTDLLLEESLRYTTPKLVVLEVYPGLVNLKKYPNRFKGFQLRVLDKIPNSKKKHIKIREFFNLKELPSVYSRLVRNHNKFKDVDFFNLDRKLKIKPNNFYYTQGYIGNFKFVKDSKIYDKYKNFKNFEKRKINENFLLDTKTKKSILNFINIARNKNIKVLIVSSPDMRARKWDYNVFNKIEIFCKKNKIKFIDLNNFYDKIGLTINDFQDPGHLNVFGGIKTTTFISDYINLNYNFRDKSNLEIWKNLEKQYLNFKNLNIGLFHRVINDKLTEDILIKSINLQKTPNKLFVKLDLEFLNISKKEIANYKLAIRIFPFKNQINLLSKKSKSKKWLFDKKDISLINVKNKLNFKIDTKINEIKTIKIYLYKTDKNQKRTNEKPIYINNLNLKPL